MTVGIKELADGQLGVSVASLYTVAASTQTLVKTISLVNTSSATVKVDIYKLTSGGTARRITPYELELAAYYKYKIEDNVTLEAVGAIQGKAAIAGVIDYVISGVEEA